MKPHSGGVPACVGTDVLHDVRLAVCVCVSWQMTAVGITENVKGDVKKFEIWYSGREEVYVVQVRRANIWNSFSLM